MWLLTAASCVLLFVVGLADPGILPHYAEPPTGAEAWRFSLQAKTYRPPDALYTRDCNVIIDGFDHVCPWTGTAIGRRNLAAFNIFLLSLFMLVCYDVALAIQSTLPNSSLSLVMGVVLAMISLGALACGCLIHFLSPGSPMASSGSGTDVQYGSVNQEV